MEDYVVHYIFQRGEKELVVTEKVGNTHLDDVTQYVEANLRKPSFSIDVEEKRVVINSASVQFCRILTDE